MKIMLFRIVAHISIPVYIMYSKGKFLFVKSLNQIEEHTKPCVTNRFSVIYFFCFSFKIPVMMNEIGKYSYIISVKLRTWKIIQYNMHYL